MSNSKIVIRRESRRVDRLRLYKILLDGNIVGEIADGQSKTIEVKPGNHVLRLKIDWCKSNEIKFQTIDNKTINFKCAFRLEGLKAIAGIVYATLLFNRYLKLERVDD